MKQHTHTAYQTNREELRSAIQKTFLSNLVRLGESAKELDFFAGNKEKEALKKAA